MDFEEALYIGFEEVRHFTPHEEVILPRLSDLVQIEKSAEHDAEVFV